MIENRDELFMSAALDEATKNLFTQSNKNSSKNLPIGAVIIHNDKIISRGHNLVQSKKTDLAHAEIEAILPVQEFLFTHKGECEIYTTLEPCIMCFGTIVHFKFKRLVIGASDCAVGALKLVSNSPYYTERMPEVVKGILADKSMKLLRLYVEETGRGLHLLSNL